MSGAVSSAQMLQRATFIQFDVTVAADHALLATVAAAHQLQIRTFNNINSRPHMSERHESPQSGVASMAMSMHLMQRWPQCRAVGALGCLGTWEGLGGMFSVPVRLTAITLCQLQSHASQIRQYERLKPQQVITG